MKIPFRRVACAAACLLAGAGAFAQEGALAPVTVTANPLGATQGAAPVSSVSGNDLLLRRQGTLGATLDGLPGVSSTYFGPTASRPIVRGLDGDRIRILENGGALRDVSGLSFDHAVSIDPISVDRIEVLRGPGALLYGGSAVGGVVNLIDGRIPTAPLDGMTGRADLGFAGGNRERQGAVLVEGGTDRLGLHVDASARRFGDTRVPAALPCAQGGADVAARRLCNSGGQAAGGAVGGSLFFDRGYLGASVSDVGNEYGSVAEDEVRLDQRSRRVALQGELRGLRGVLQSLKAQASHTDYRHTESDAGVTGTVFRTTGSDLRLEARHARIGPLEGVIGFQWDDSRLSAEGGEAFLPPSDTRERALFIHEELPTAWGKLSVGARTERVDVASAAARRAFTPSSASVGAVWNLPRGWQITGSWSRTQRAPKDYELFADGPHVATGAFEVGDAALGLERSTSVDAALQWREGPHRARVGVFRNRFSDFIALLSTGRSRDTGEELLPEFAYRAVAARLRGVEAEGSVRLLAGAQSLDLEWRADLVRADNLTLGQPLPRIAPLRTGATLAWASGPWGARLGFDRWARQSRVPDGEAPVAGYTLWNSSLTYKARAGRAEMLWYARLENIADRLAFSPTSILTQTAPGRVPLPGRSLRVGVRADF